MRYSKQREEVLMALRGTRIHPDAEWLYQKVRQNLSTVSRGTIYRNLKELYQNHDILMFNTGEIMHFDGDTSPHSHFVCKSCGQIIDLPVTSECQPLLINLGYKVDSEHLIFYGDCIDCQKNKGEKEIGVMAERGINNNN